MSETLDPGHVYKLLPIDGDDELILRFVKREGDGYPGNQGHHCGTNLQSVIRALHERVRYLDGQIHHPNNVVIIRHLEECNWLLEQRAAERHELAFSIDEKQAIALPMCPICGHVVCHHSTYYGQLRSETVASDAGCDASDSEQKPVPYALDRFAQLK